MGLLTMLGISLGVNKLLNSENPAKEAIMILSVIVFGLMFAVIGMYALFTGNILITFFMMAMIFGLSAVLLGIILK